MYKWKTQINQCYYGKATCCHSQALLTAFFSQNLPSNLWIFETHTTVPFGIVHVPNDPNRLIDCYFDPDLGLDRVLDTFNIPYEVHYWHAGTDGAEAIKLLCDWCTESPVVLGPLNMSGLRYFFHNELFYRMDHYIVALGFEGNRIQVCDPEGFVLALISIDNLLNAWRGDQIPEGRGEFIMRRILGNHIKLISSQETYLKTLHLATENLIAARQMQYGGSQALLTLAKTAAIVESNTSLRRGLTYVIPTRIQRCVFIMEFIQQILSEPFSQTYEKDLNEIITLLNEQIMLYSQVLAGIMDKLQGTLVKFEQLADLEENMTVIFEHIGNEL